MTNALALSDYQTHDKTITYHLFEAYKGNNAEKFTQNSPICGDHNVKHSRYAKFIYTNDNDNDTRLELAKLENDGDINICGNCVKQLYKN